MFINNLCIASTAQEWTGLGLTASDWAAVITLLLLLISTLGGLLIIVLRDKSTNPLSRVIDKLSDTVDRLIEANTKRDEQYTELTKHVEQHDKQFIQDEAKINEVFDLIKNGHGGSNDDKQN